MGNYFGYMRISTQEERGLQRFTRQEKALSRYQEESVVQLLMTFKDDCSGATFNRPQWKALEQILQPGDTVVFKDVSRFTRDAAEGFAKYWELYQKGVNLVFLDNSTISTDYVAQMFDAAKSSKNRITSKAIENTVELLVLVELDRCETERRQIAKRIADGMAASSKRPGRPAGKLDKLTPELEADLHRYMNDRNIKQIDILEKHQISRNTFKKYLRLLSEDKKNSANS